MTSTNKRIMLTLLTVDLVMMLISIIFFDTKVLYNTQIGFISATLVMIASMISYSRMVNARVEHNVITYDDSKDVIDILEDPYDLYSEEIQNEEKEEPKEDKKKPKDNRSLYQILKDTKAALSAYRLGAYLTLILGFLYLNRHELLHIPSYILALSIPPMVIVVLLIREKDNV